MITYAKGAFIFLILGMIALVCFSFFSMNVPSKQTVPNTGNVYLLTEELREAIAHVERESILPREASAKVDYYRYYAIKESDNERMLYVRFLEKGLVSSGVFGDIQGLEVYGSSNKNVIFVGNDNLPNTNDGRCGIISLFYDLTSQTLKSEKQAIVDTTTGVSKDVIVHGYCNGFG